MNPLQPQKFTCRFEKNGSVKLLYKKTFKGIQGLLFINAAIAAFLVGYIFLF